MRCICSGAATIILALNVHSQPTPVLSQPQIEELERTVERNAGDRASQALLGKNYALFILGITSFGEFGTVASVNTTKAAGGFAQHARDELRKSVVAAVVAEAGQALWQYSTAVEVYERQHRSPINIDTDSARTLAVQSLDRAISMEPNNATWRMYRIPILMFRSEFSNFMPLTVSEAYAQVKQDLSVITGSNRPVVLTYAAKLAVKASEWEDARSYAQELLTYSTDAKSWNLGNVIFIGNMVLGQVALHQGDVDAAKAYLLAAGKTPGSPQLNSFGPNMSLAKDLLSAGERETVLAFLDECRTFWKTGRGQLKEWADQINANHMPDFGANLTY